MKNSKIKTLKIARTANILLFKNIISMSLKIKICIVLYLFHICICVEAVKNLFEDFILMYTNYNLWFRWLIRIKFICWFIHSRVNKLVVCVKLWIHRWSFYHIGLSKWGSFLCFIQVDTSWTQNVFWPWFGILTKLNSFGYLCFTLEQRINEKDSQSWRLDY